MGRELKRVALSFDWPLEKTWEGYLNNLPGATTCVECQGTGLSKFAIHLKDLWYGDAPFTPKKPITPDNEAVQQNAKRNMRENADASIIQEEAERLCKLFNSQWSYHLEEKEIKALVKDNRLMDFTHVWIKDQGWTKKPDFKIPTPEEVQAWSILTFGHDCINQWVVSDAVCKQKRQAKSCLVCKGSGGIYPTKAIEKAYKAWKRTEPPSGTGYQVWETVSEGSPISPVFATPEELAHYMATKSRDRNTASYDHWMKFILGDGWAPSFVMQIPPKLGTDGLISGVQAIAELE